MRVINEIESLPLGTEAYLSNHDELNITLDGSKFRWTSEMVIEALDAEGASDPDPDCMQAGCASCLDEMIVGGSLDDLGASNWVWESLEEARPGLWASHRHEVIRSAELISDHRNLTADSRSISWTIDPMIPEPDLAMVEEARREFIANR